MTIWGLLRAAAHRWYIVVLGVVCTAALALYVLVHPDVYWSRADVVFLAPSSSAFTNPLMTTTSDVVMTAGVVARLVNGTEVRQKTASTEATLVGRGVRNGHSIALPDAGGQWAPHFDRQVLVVEVAGPTADAVRERQRELVTEIVTVLDGLQDEARVVPGDRITTELVPAAPPVHHLDGDRRRALAMTLVLGPATTLMAVGAVERIGRRRGEAAGR